MSSVISRSALLLAAVFTLAISGTASAGGALAAEGEPPEATETNVVMTITDIDENRAREAGNVVKVRDGYRVLIDGKSGEEIARVPLKDKEKASGDVSTNATGTAYGDCGSSYVSIENVSQSDIYRFRTGFDLTSSAVDFDWYINIRASNSSGVYNFDWSDHGPMWPDNNWTSGWKTDDTPLNAYHYIRITSGTAYLANGGVCTSGYPSANTWVT